MRTGGGVGPKKTHLSTNQFAYHVANRIAKSIQTDGFDPHSVNTEIIGQYGPRQQKQSWTR